MGLSRVRGAHTAPNGAFGTQASAERGPIVVWVPQPSPPRGAAAHTLPRAPTGSSEPQAPPRSHVLATESQGQQDQIPAALQRGTAGAGESRARRLRSRSPRSTQTVTGAPWRTARPPGPAAPCGPGGVPQAGDISSPHVGPCPHGTPGTKRCQHHGTGAGWAPVLHPGTGTGLVPVGSPGKDSASPQPPLKPPKIAQLPPPRQLPASSSPLPTDDPGGGREGAGGPNPPRAHLALPARLGLAQPPPARTAPTARPPARPPSLQGAR